MKFFIRHPTKAIISSMKPEEIPKLQKKLSYTNTSISYQISKVKQMRWLKRKDPEAWQEKLNGLYINLKSCLLMGGENGDPYWIRPGSIPYIDDKADIWRGVEYPELKPLPWKMVPIFDPYQYQLDAVRLLLEIKHGNIALPTGTGKSFILLMLAKQMGLNIVVVTPSKSIFNELLVSFKKHLGSKHVGGYGDGKKDIKKMITIAIGKSLTMLKEGTQAYEFFKNKQAILVDESHTFAADQLNNVCHGVLSNISYRFFVSATQTRNDGTEKLLQSIIGETVLEMSLKEAIKKGYLCRLEFNIIDTFSPDTRIYKDPTKTKREHFLYNKNIADFSARIGNASWSVKKQSTLIVVEELRQIQMLTKRLKVPYTYIHSSDAKKADEWGLQKVKNLQEEVDKFNNGTVRVLIGTKAICTGTNIYPTHNTVNWMGGGSEIATKQGPMGRSTRKLDKYCGYQHLHTPKDFSMIFDFNVAQQPKLKQQLKKRVSWYKESGAKVNI